MLSTIELGRHEPVVSPTPRILTVVFGDRDDGINVFGRGLRDHQRAVGVRRDVVDTSSAAWERTRADVVHLDLSDRLVAAASTEWDALCRWATRSGVPLVVTLHDIPQDAEGVERFRRRATACRKIAARCDLVIVCSASEQVAAARCGIESVVVHHPVFPVQRAGLATVSPKDTPTMVVAGFVHPGKGVRELLSALGDVRGSELEGWQLRLVGAATQKHADEPSRLRAMAEDRGLDFFHTGRVSGAQWASEMASATVAVCPHLHCSASGSILSWIAHGRRPLTPDLPFCRELTSERSDVVRIVRRPDHWRSTILAASAEGPARHVSLDGWRSPDAAGQKLDEYLLSSIVRRRASGGCTGR